MVEYVDIFDKKYPIRIGYLVMKRVKEETGKSLGQALQQAKDDPTIHETILFAALQMGAFAERQELDLKEEDMPMVLDLCFSQYVKAFTSDKFFPKEALSDVEDKVAELGKAEGKKEAPKTPKKKQT